MTDDQRSREHAERRDRRRARGWQANELMERLLDMKRSDPEKFERSVGSTMLMQLGYYASAKAAHERTNR